MYSTSTAAATEGTKQPKTTVFQPGNRVSVLVDHPQISIRARTEGIVEQHSGELVQVNFGEAYGRSVVMSQSDLQTVTFANTEYNPVPSVAWRRGRT